MYYNKKHNSLFFESVYTTCHDAEIAQRRFRCLGFHCSALCEYLEKECS